jgi:hypothetical protein
MVPPPQQGPNRRGDRTVVFIVIAVIVLFCFGCLGTCFYPAVVGFAPGPASTVPGPEDGSLRRGLRGNLAFDSGLALHVLSFPEEATQSIPIRQELQGLGGMDGRGRLWTIEDGSLMWRTVSGDIGWLVNGGSGEVGHTLAVTPEGTAVAWLVEVKSPDTDTARGRIEVWDVDARKARRFAVAADDRLSWFPDGVRLAFVRRRDGVPAVMVLDTRSGKVTPFADGAEPTVAADGSGILVRDSGSYYWIPMRTRERQEVADSSISKVIAVLDADRLLAYANPTEGHPIVSRGDVGETWPQALKVFSRRSGRFVTLADGLSDGMEAVAYIPLPPPKVLKSVKVSAFKDARG